MAVHHIEPLEGSVHWDFDRAREPILWVESGDVVTYRTLDASGYLEKRKLDGSGSQMDRKGAGWGHTLCGPVGVRGARAGQTLEIEIIDVRPGNWGWTGSGGFSTPLNDRLGVSDVDHLLMIWTIDADAGTAVNQWGHIVHLRPFMGVMGMPSADPGPHPTAPPRFCGGNLDCKELTRGTKLYLPIPVDDALFSLGDGHGVQGDGEVSGMAIECPMDHVEVKLTVLDAPTLAMPRAWTSEGWLTFGLHEELNEAVAIAIDEMLRLIDELLGQPRTTALGLASLFVDVRITQLVNGVVGAHAVLPHAAVGGDTR
jgi:acetamidase/formamidase